MAATAAKTGKGSTLGHATTSGGTAVIVGELKSIKLPKLNYPLVDATHYTSDNSTVELIPSGWKSSDPIPVVCNYTTAEAALIYAAGGTLLYWTVTLPDTHTYKFPGVISDFGGDDVPKDGVIQMSFTVTPTGAIVYA